MCGEYPEDVQLPLVLRIVRTRNLEMLERFTKKATFILELQPRRSLEKWGFDEATVFNFAVKLGETSFCHHGR
jgi:hypothetical protein